MTTNVLFLKFVKTDEENDESFERRIRAYKSKVGKHNESMHPSNHYFDSGFDIFQPKNDYGILGKKTYKVDLGIQTAMYNVNKEFIGEEKHSNYYSDNNSWNEVIEFSTNTVENFTQVCDSMQARPEPYVIHPRSSIYKKSFRLANSTGIIDTGYRGNLAAVIDNDDDFGKHSEENRNVLVEGERYFQICRADLQRFYILTVQDLPSTDRGEGGFGSTGN